MQKESNKKNFSIQAKSGMWFVACGILQKGITFLSMPIFTRLMLPEDYGKYNIYVSWLQIITIISSLYLYYGVFSNAMSKYKEDRDTYISSMQGLIITINALLFLLFCLFSGAIVEYTKLSTTLFYYMFAEMVLTPSLEFWLARQRFEYKYKSVVFVTVIRALINPGLGILLVLTWKDSVVGRITATIIVDLVICGYLMIMQFWKGRVFFHKKYWNYALKLALPIVPNYIAGMILSHGDRIMISSLVGDRFVAFYSIAYSIGMIVQIGTQAIINAMSPWMYASFDNNAADNFPKVINVLVDLVAICACLVSLVGPELIFIFGSSEYSNAVYVIPPVAMSVICIFLYNIFSFPEFYYEKTKYLMMASVLACALNIALNYIFIQIYGYVAAGYTTLVCYVLYSIGHYFVSKKIMRINKKQKTLFDIKHIVYIIISACIFILIMNFIYPYRIVRYLVLVGFLIYIWLSRKQYIMVIKDIR